MEKKKEKSEYETMIECFNTVLFYNWYSDFFRDMYKLYKVKRKEIDRYSFSVWEYIDREKFSEEFLAQIQVLRMMLVEMFGEYWTSPRYWWIIDDKWFEEFMEWLLNRLSD